MGQVVLKDFSPSASIALLVDLLGDLYPVWDLHLLGKSPAITSPPTQDLVVFPLLAVFPAEVLKVHLVGPFDGGIVVDPDALKEVTFLLSFLGLYGRCFLGQGQQVVREFVKGGDGHLSDAEVEFNRIAWGVV